MDHHFADQSLLSKVAVNHRAVSPRQNRKSRNKILVENTRIVKTTHMASQSHSLVPHLQGQSRRPLSGGIFPLS
jgi:hypothetical protein